MAKDYFQDITPPDGSKSIPPKPLAPEAPPNIPPRPTSVGESEAPERTIRNIQVSPTRSLGGFGGGEREHLAPPPRPGGGRFWLWAAIAFAVLIIGAIALVALRPTSITVIPRSHTVLFDETALFTAYPASSAATGTLAFTLETSNFEDSQVVPTQGTENVSERASGIVTVYNNYSADTVRLIANTRFEAPGGLIFRVPAEVVVPGKRGSVPGEIEVTVFADAPGEKYNVGPVEKFTLPGLKSTPAMYSGVYARSASAMTGGFVGERAAAAPGAIEGARAEVRSRLQEKVSRMIALKASDSTIAFSELARVTFESLPQTTEAEGGVRIHERARVELPVFSKDEFASVIAESVSADAERGSIMLRPGTAFSAHLQTLATSSSATAPLQFSLEGSADLVWKVDTGLLAEALAGRDEAAFKAIIEGFPGIEEARARIEPFWKNTFPKDPGAIRINIKDPKLSE